MGPQLPAEGATGELDAFALGGPGRPRRRRGAEAAGGVTLIVSAYAPLRSRDQVEAVLLDIEWHEVESSENAFYVAARCAASSMLGLRNLERAEPSDGPVAAGDPEGREE